jgi:hypothetical protein
VRVAKLVAGTETELGLISMVWEASKWYFIRLRAVGSEIKARAWLASSAEPATWGVEVTDAGVASAGYAGVYARHVGTNPSFGYVAIAPGNIAPIGFSVPAIGGGGPAPVMIFNVITNSQYIALLEEEF